MKSPTNNRAVALIRGLVDLCKSNAISISDFREDLNKNYLGAGSQVSESTVFKWFARRGPKTLPSAESILAIQEWVARNQKQ